MEINDLSIRYNNFQLKGISLKLNEGEVLGIAGANGSGKTTLVEAIAGIRSIDSGEISYRGNKLGKDWMEYKLNALIISLDVPFFQGLSTFENMKLVSSFLPVRHTVDELNKYIRMVGLSSASRTIYRDLSKGMKQRLALAEYFLRKPELVIMDEPTEGLDPALKADVNAILASIRNGNGSSRAALIVSHDLSLLSSVCSRILLISGGQIVEGGTYEQIIDNFQERYIVVNAGIDKVMAKIPDLRPGEGIRIGPDSTMIPSKYEEGLRKDGLKIGKPEPHDIFRRDDYQ